MKELRNEEIKIVCRIAESLSASRGCTEEVGSRK